MLQELFSKESYHFVSNNLQRLFMTYFLVVYIFLMCTGFTQQSQGLELLCSTKWFINSLFHYHLYSFRLQNKYSVMCIERIMAADVQAVHLTKNQG